MKKETIYDFLLSVESLHLVTSGDRKQKQDITQIHIACLMYKFLNAYK